jgi:NAD+ synthase
VREATRVLQALRARVREAEARYAPIREIERAWYALDDRTGEAALELLARWTAAHVERTGAKGLVVGVSGGVDSTLAAIVMQRAVGERGVGYLLPARSAAEDEDDGRALLEALGVEARTFELTGVVEACLAAMSTTDADPMAVGNLASRIRNAVLYFEASRQGKLVLGTADLDETWIGYGCKGAAADLSPIVGLHKHEVRALVHRALAPVDEALADRLAGRPATPGYYPGHDAEAELGMSYVDIAAALDALVPACALSLEGGVEPVDSLALRAEMKRGALDGDTVLKVAELMERALHKTTASPALFRAPYDEWDEGDE